MARSPIASGGPPGQGWPVLFYSRRVNVLADYPCDLHLARYKGPSHRVYVNVYREEECIKLKASVCEACLIEWLHDFAQRAFYQTPQGTWDPGEEGTDLATAWMDAEPSPRPLRRPRAS